MNYTDVDDKTIKGSIQEKYIIEFTENTELHSKDINTLNIKPATIYCAATKHIKKW